MTDYKTAPLTGDEIRAAVKHAHNMSGPSDATQPGEYVLAGALALLSKLRAEGVQAGDEDTPPIAPDDVAVADAWITASDCDGIAYDGPSFERGYRAALASAPVPPAEVMDALNWLDDFVARCNGDDRGVCESVNLLRRALASASVAKPSLASEEFAQEVWAAAQSPHGEPMEKSVARVASLLTEFSAPVADERVAVQAAPGRQYHILKTDPEVFQAVLSGAKTFEIRLNDRGYAVGDVLGLRETNHTGAEMRAGAPLVYTGRECQRFVSHVLTGYGLADGWCCLSFELPHAGGESAPVAGEAVGWRVRERRSNDGKLLDCFVEAPAAPGMAYGQEVLGDDYAEAQGGIEGKLKHCQLIVAWANAAPQASGAVCSCPTGDGSLRHPCAVHPHGEKDGGHGSDQAPPQSPPQNRTEALHG